MSVGAARLLNKIINPTVRVLASFRNFHNQLVKLAFSIQIPNLKGTPVCVKKVLFIRVRASTGGAGGRISHGATIAAR